MLLTKFLGPRGFTHGGLAKQLGVTRPLVSLLVRGRRRVSTDMAARLARTLGTTPEYWLELQNAWDLWELDHPAPRPATTREVKPAASAAVEFRVEWGVGERELRVTVVREARPAPPTGRGPGAGGRAEHTAADAQGLATARVATEQAPLRIDHDGRTFRLWVENVRALHADAPATAPPAHWVVEVAGLRERLCAADDAGITEGELHARVAVWWARRGRQRLASGGSAPEVQGLAAEWRPRRGDP